MAIKAGQLKERADYQAYICLLYTSMRSFWLARDRQFPIGQANISVPYSGLRDCCTVLIWKMTKQK